MAYQCLKEYFLLDEEAFRKKKSIRLDRKKIIDYETAKRKLYRRFVCAACLYEIFTDKFLGAEVWETFYASMEKLLDYAKQFQNLQDELRMKLKSWNEEKKDEERMETIGKEICQWEEKFDVFSREIVSSMEGVNQALCQAYFCIIHTKYIIALYAIISMVEFTNINANLVY